MTCTHRPGFQCRIGAAVRLRPLRGGGQVPTAQYIAAHFASSAALASGVPLASLVRPVVRPPRNGASIGQCRAQRNRPNRAPRGNGCAERRHSPVASRGLTVACAIQSPSNEAKTPGTRSSGYVRVLNNWSIESALSVRKPVPSAAAEERRLGRPASWNPWNHCFGPVARTCQAKTGRSAWLIPAA